MYALFHASFLSWVGLQLSMTHSFHEGQNVFLFQKLLFLYMSGRWNKTQLQLSFHTYFNFIYHTLIVYSDIQSFQYRESI